MAREDGFDVVCPQPGADRMMVPDNWTFESKEVADHFDDHVREQLPWYDLATQGVVHVARHFMPRCATVYDIGASTGNIGKALRQTMAERDAKFYAIEESSATDPPRITVIPVRLHGDVRG